MKMPVIFTDLDGTLLDYSTYSFEKALPALNLMKQKKIPVIICSSKTRKEIEYYRKKLNNHQPFVSENGGGIFIPKEYFGFPIHGLSLHEENKIKTSHNNAKDKEINPLPPLLKGGKGGLMDENDYQVIRLGARYSDLRKAVEELRREGFFVRGFGDMTVEEIIAVTNLSIDEAEMAKERDFDEPFIFVGAIHELPLLCAFAVKRSIYLELPILLE
ncbi:MAG: HAD hydrolase family protein [Planctomycetota bacterium]|nr:HAD hydrolase family protein [Planctomycetota bacterium]MDI6787315.1 HAD hydrolase family protein [Planctomycetota bacterium]